jgi:hypothetical protein
VRSIVFRAETIAMTDEMRAHREFRVQKSDTRIQNSSIIPLHPRVPHAGTPNHAVHLNEPRPFSFYYPRTRLTHIPFDGVIEGVWRPRLTDNGRSCERHLFRDETIAMTDVVRAHGEFRIQKSDTRIQNSRPRRLALAPRRGIIPV